MSDFITPVVDILNRLCSYCTKRAYSIRNLGENLNSLRNASNQLNSRHLDVKMKVEIVEQDPNQHMVVLNEVRDWMGRVEDLQNEVQAILQQGNQEEIQAKCFGGRCPKNCRARYKLYKVATRKLSDVNDLISRGNFDDVAKKLARDRFDELPVDKAVGVESTFEELCSCFENNQVGIIGLYGMGGVGKTTLLKKFNNEFLSTKAHSIIIWLVVSKEADPGKFQEAIRKKLNVEDGIWDNKTVDERAILLYNILKEKKFVLLLDDVWKRIDVLKLGVPSKPNNHQSKIIFTTRSEKVCRLMGAQTSIKVKCLTQDKAFELFKEKVGETTLENRQILHLAKKVVDECKGLPLALCTVGRAMTNVVTPNEWKRTLEILKSYPSRVSGMVEEVYYLLEFSYDRLPKGTYKSCFLYCALFPEDYNIGKEDLILLWIAEGFLAECDYNIHEASKQGEDIISNLKHACLLENGDRENTVKMHDVIRDMAFWVACDHGEKARFFMKDGSGSSVLEVYNYSKWKEVERLSLWRRVDVNLNFLRKPHCANLLTMLIRDTPIQHFPTEVFILSSTIRVLDLSSNEGITNLPSAIGDFVNLEHLDLSYTGITKLVEELKNLKKLRHLLLDGTGVLEFPKGVISNLSSLQLFSMAYGAFPMDVEDMLLDELEGLDRLQDTRVFITSRSSLQKIVISSKLQRCMCRLQVYCLPDTSLLHNLFSSLEKMEHLEILSVFGDILPEDSETAKIPRGLFCGDEYRITLRELTLYRCQNMVDLNWLIHAPNLEILRLRYCDLLLEVIAEDFGNADTEIVKSNLFSSLTHLTLGNLRNLRSICAIALQFPCLKKIDVEYCPNLKKLPFNSQSALKITEISGVQNWLDQLQWEDEATKQLFVSKFRRR